METLNEEHITPYWRQLFTKICPQSSLDEWEGVNFVQIVKAAMNGDKSAKEYIFWQMKDIIETKFSKDRKRISIWAKHLNISEKNGEYSANDVVDNWVSASWMAIFDGYPITDTNTIGPFIKYVKPGRELDYLTWVYYTKVGAILYMSNNLEATGGMSTELTRNLGNIKQDLTTSSSNEKVGSGDHSINREVQDDITSDIANPEEEFELRDNLKMFRAFTRDPELTEKKNGFSPMIAFKTVIANMAKGENAEKNIANLAAKYNVSRNTFANYAQRAANDLVEVYNITLNDLQNLIKRYGPDALSRLIKESSYNPKPLNNLKENYNFKLLESIFNGKAILNESDESIYDAHAEYEKDVEQKKEEDDNQENFKFDEGSVKLTTVKESDESISKAHEEFKKDQKAKKEEDDNQENFKFDEGSVKLTTVKEGARKYYIRMEYAEGDDAWDDIYGPFTAEKAEQEYNSMRKEFAYAISQGCAEVYYCTANGDYTKPPLKESRGTYTGNIAECPCCGHTIRQDQYEDYTCEECGELWEDDDLDWHPDGDEYEDGYDNRITLDLEESTNLKESENSYKAKAYALCEELTKNIDWDNDDNDLDQAADNILCFIYSMIDESMEYFPTDAYDPELWKVFLANKEKYENVLN